MDFLFQVKLRLLTHNKNVEAVLSMYEDVTVRVCNMFFPFLPYVMCFFLNRALEFQIDYWKVNFPTKVIILTLLHKQIGIKGGFCFLYFVLSISVHTTLSSLRLIFLRCLKEVG